MKLNINECILLILDTDSDKNNLWEVSKSERYMKTLESNNVELFEFNPNLETRLIGNSKNKKQLRSIKKLKQLIKIVMILKIKLSN